MLKDLTYSIKIGFNFSFPSFPATFDLLLISLSNVTSTNLVAKFFLEQLLLRIHFINSGLNSPPLAMFSDDDATSSTMANGGTTAGGMDC